MSVVSTYQYPDPEDAFSREPFVVKFSAPSSGEFDAALFQTYLCQTVLESHTPTFHSRQGARADPPACSTTPGSGRD